MEAYGRFTEAQGRFKEAYRRFTQAYERFMVASGSLVEAHGRYMEAYGRFMEAVEMTPNRGIDKTMLRYMLGHGFINTMWFYQYDVFSAVHGFYQFSPRLRCMVYHQTYH